MADYLSTQGKTALQSELNKQLRNLGPNSHLCLFYDRNPAEQMPALVPFIQDALTSDERFIYIADDQTVDDLSQHLESDGVNVKQEIAQGRLQMLTRQQWRPPGSFTASKKIQQVSRLIRDSARSGFKGVRFAAEMTWILDSRIPPSELENCEATFNTLFDPHFPCRVLCQYNRSRLSPRTLLSAMYTHPKIIIGDRIYSNLFYQGPLILSGKKQKKKSGQPQDLERAEWMISQLKRFRSDEEAHGRMLQMRVNLAESERETERRRADEALNRLGAIVASSDDAIVGKDLDGIITSWNTGAERLFGFTAREVIGKSITILIPPERLSEEPNILGRIRRGDHIDHYETVRRRKDGALLDISLTVSPIKDRDGKIIGVSKIARDITERKRTEAELQRWQSELENRVRQRTEELAGAHHLLRQEFDQRKRLEADIARAVEREQLRLGQKLHDGLGQELMGISYQMSVLHDRLAKIAPAEAERLKKLENLMRRGANETRNLARDFYPVDLETAGLIGALQLLARNTQEHFGIPCQAAGQETKASKLKMPIAIQFYRIAQEAVHNAVKHAKPKRIDIRFEGKRSHVSLSISDDGIGFPSGKVIDGLGMQIMRHRASLIGGLLTVSNPPSRGVLICCRCARKKTS